MQEQGSLPPVNAGICLTAEFNEMRGSWRGLRGGTTWKSRYAYKHDSSLSGKYSISKAKEYSIEQSVL